MGARLKVSIIILIPALLAILAVAQYASTSLGYVKFTIELYDSKGLKIANSFGIAIIPDNLKIIAQVYAVAPPNHDSPVVEVHKGELKGGTLTLQPKGLLGKIAQAWVDFERSRGVNPAYSDAGLELNLWIIDEETSTVLQRISYFYTYNPEGLLNGDKRHYIIKIAINTTQASTQTEGAEDPLQDQCTYYYNWKLNFSVTPERNLSAYGYENVEYRNGAWYIKAPILSVYNKHTYSSPISSWIGLSNVEFKAAIGIGLGIEKKLKEGELTGGLDGKSYLGGITRSVIADSGWSTLPIGGEEWAYIWIWARPVMLFYNEYLTIQCPDFTYKEYTGWDKIEFFVQDIIIEYAGQIGGKDLYRIIGSESYSPLPSYITSWLFNNTLSEYIHVISLDKNKGHSFSFILLPIKACAPSFELPLGASLAEVLASTGLPHFAPLAAMMAPSIPHEGLETIYVSGGVYNHGPLSEDLYLRVSKLQYRKDPPWWKPWEDPCYYQLPAFMYIESR